MPKHKTIHIPQWKKDEIEEIKALIKTYPVVGVVEMHEIPARQLQQMRVEFKDRAVIKTSRNTLMERALSQSDEKIRPLSDFVKGQTALIFTQLNPFKLYKLIEKSKSPAPAKGGDIAPHDVIVERGTTSFKPGPIVGELQNAGIPAAIEGGSVVIRESKMVAKTGEVISPKLAEVLTRLGIYPMEVGLRLRAAHENGTIFTPDVLAVDESKYFSDFMIAVRNALNLAIDAAYPTSMTVRQLLQKAFNDSRNLAISATILIPEVIKTMLIKASVQAMLLSANIPRENKKEDNPSNPEVL
ncbi:MAG: 50S ribosomal protein L10 [Methanocellales archaeon]|nr:50S ribosomal protein L10 [Methanocellales archaeon]